MQVIPPLSAPVVPGALPEQAAKLVPQIQAQAAMPITQRAVDPSNKSDRGSRNRSNGDRAKGGGQDGRGGNVNIRV